MGSIPWKRVLRFSNIVHGSSQRPSINCHVNGESNDLMKSVDDESRVPSIVTPKAPMANKALKTPDNNNGV